jgi:hypothetical protein
MGGEVKSMRGLVLAVGALVIVAACGRVPGGQVSSGDYKLYEAASTSSAPQLSVIDSRSHSVELNMPLGTPSPDWTHLYMVSGDGLIDIDPQTGTKLQNVRMPGYFQLPAATLSGVPGGLSQDGRWLVLERFDPTTSPIPSTTHLLVVETSFGKPMQQFDLPGYFQFDAISNDGKRIFLIQYISNTEYYVRQFDVGIGQLNPTIIFDKADGGAAMAGVRISGIPSPDGHWLYSLYVRHDKSPFIHALNLDGNLIAFCVDLPGSGYGSDSNALNWSLAMNSNATHLYAANGASGIVADIGLDAGSGWPSQPRAARLDNGQTVGFLGVQSVEAKEIGGSAAAVSPDGNTLVVGGKTGLVWVDTTSLKAKDHQLSDWNVWSLAMSPDGTAVYAVRDDGMIAEISMSGSHQMTTFGGAPGQPLALIRVAEGPAS